MIDTQTTLSKMFTDFFDSEKSGGVLLIICTVVSLAIANSAFGSAYLDFWHVNVAGLTVEHWINDALMAVFFLFVGLELERELYNGELSNFKNALLPIFCRGRRHLCSGADSFRSQFGYPNTGGNRHSDGN